MKSYIFRTGLKRKHTPTHFGKEDTEKPVNLQEKSYCYLLIINSDTTELRGERNPSPKTLPGSPKSLFTFFR